MSDTDEAYNGGGGGWGDSAVEIDDTTGAEGGDIPEESVEGPAEGGDIPAEDQEAAAQELQDGAAEHVELPNGLRNVSVSELPDPDGINGPEDFRKVTPEQMEASLRRLEEIRPAVESGEGADSDYWYARDQEQGLGPADGYQAAYNAFYGKDAITMDKVDGQYNILDGRHRVWMAKQMNVDTLPARVFDHDQE